MDAEAQTRVLALDVGRKRIGLALSDPLGITAQGIDTFQRTNIREDLSALCEIIRRNNVSLLLVGNPLHMSGAESRQAAWTHEFAERLSVKSGVPVQYWDERLTTVEAERFLRETGASIEKRARDVDKLAAVILLRSYLDAVEFSSGGNPA